MEFSLHKKQKIITERLLSGWRLTSITEYDDTYKYLIMSSNW